MKIVMRVIRRVFCSHLQWEKIHSSYAYDHWKCRRCGKEIERFYSDPPISYVED